MRVQTNSTPITGSSTSSLYCLVYASSATRPFSSRDLLELLDVARRNNSELGVTGLLLHSDGNFMQALEGEERIVRELHSRIAKDSRHTGVITLLQGPIEKRSFDSWSMGFRDIRSPEVEAIPGFSPFLNVPLNDRRFRDDPSRSMRLLALFRDNMR